MRSSNTHQFFVLRLFNNRSFFLCRLCVIRLKNMVKLYKGYMIYKVMHGQTCCNFCFTTFFFFFSGIDGGVTSSSDSFCSFSVPTFCNLFLLFTGFNLSSFTCDGIAFSFSDTSLSSSLSSSFFSRNKQSSFVPNFQEM